MSREVDRSIALSFDPDEFRPHELPALSPWMYSMPDASVLLVNARAYDEQYRHEQDVARANRVEHHFMMDGVDTVDSDRV